MTARYLWLLVLSLGLAACSGGGTTTKTGDDDDDDTSPPGDDDDDDTAPGDDDDDDTNTPPPTGETGTGGGGSGFYPKYFIIDATFAFDQQTRQLSPYTVYGTQVDPNVSIYFGNDTWFASYFDFSLTAEYCTIQFPLTDSSLAPWVQGDPTLWYGVDYTGDPVLTNCNDQDHPFDPANWGADPVGAITSYGWGTAVGEIAPEMAVYIPAPDYTAITEDRAGARVMTQFIYETWAYLTVPVSVDGSFEAQTDGAGYFVTFPPEDVYLGQNNIATGAYIIFGVYYYSFNFY
jgi:hypothetical protein